MTGRWNSSIPSIAGNTFLKCLWQSCGLINIHTKNVCSAKNNQQMHWSRHIVVFIVLSLNQRVNISGPNQSMSVCVHLVGQNFEFWIKLCIKAEVSILGGCHGWSLFAKSAYFYKSLCREITFTLFCYRTIYHLFCSGFVSLKGQVWWFNCPLNMVDVKWFGGLSRWRDAERSMWKMAFRDLHTKTSLLTTRKYLQNPGCWWPWVTWAFEKKRQEVFINVL